MILGHVTALNDKDQAVFRKLGAFRKSDEISVSQGDGQVAVFAVTRIVQRGNPDFSSMDTCGNTNDSQLRLITCVGTFHESTDRDPGNIVVNAKLTYAHPPITGPTPHGVRMHRRLPPQDTSEQHEGY